MCTQKKVPNFITSFVANLKGSDVLQNLDIDVRIILKLVLWKLWTGFVWL
jgi:hypothetical protein